MPAYISFERYRRNQAQLQSNRAAWGGAPRAGTALLSGILVCGRCGLRMLAQYNNNGHTARYVCQAMKSSYGAPFCQSLKARPLDDLIASLVLEAVTPAAIEASVALAENLEAERAALDRHWLQRLERAGYEVERARRQYAAVEPENRLVARTLERAWEAALTEQARLEADYERLKRDKSPRAERGRNRGDPRADAGFAGALASPDHDSSRAPDHRALVARTGSWSRSWGARKRCASNAIGMAEAAQRANLVASDGEASARVIMNYYANGWPIDIDQAWRLSRFCCWGGVSAFDPWRGSDRFQGRDRLGIRQDQFGALGAGASAAARQSALLDPGV